MRIIFASLALAACASTDTLEPSRAASAAPVIAAERAFAARAGEVGWVPAFREYVAPNGELAQPNGYANAPAELATTPDDGNRNLFWWPAYAGISRDADFGFTTGPVSFDEVRTPRGHYFTVWRRQSDGSWKWIYDGGVGPIAEPNQIAPGAEEVPALPVAAGGGASSDAAIAEVRALERGGALAYAPDARSYRTRMPPMTGAPREVPAEIAYSLHRVEAASSGDLVMVLGSARWSVQGGEAEGCSRGCGSIGPRAGGSSTTNWSRRARPLRSQPLIDLRGRFRQKPRFPRRTPIFVVVAGRGSYWATGTPPGQSRSRLGDRRSPSEEEGASSA